VIHIVAAVLAELDRADDHVGVGQFPTGHQAEVFLHRAVVAVGAAFLAVEQGIYFIARDFGLHVLKINQDRQAAHRSFVQLAAFQQAFIWAVDLGTGLGLFDGPVGPQATKLVVKPRVAYILGFFEMLP